MGFFHLGDEGVIEEPVFLAPLPGFFLNRGLGRGVKQVISHSCSMPCGLM